MKFQGGATVAKEIDISPVEVKTVHNKVYAHTNLDASNEVVPVVKTEAQPAVVVKEVSKWRGSRQNRSSYTGKTFYNIMSAWLSAPQIRLSQPLWLNPRQFNYVKQVCRQFI